MSNLCHDYILTPFLDTQVSLAPTHVSPSVRHTFGFPISGRPSVATVTKEVATITKEVATITKEVDTITKEVDAITKEVSNTQSP